MNDSSPLSSPSTGHSRSPWNKDKIIGPRPPLRPGHVWSIRAKLHLELRARDLALFNLAIDSKLCADAISWHCASMTWRLKATQSTAPTCARGKPVDRCGSN
jgi:hypothetical protein